METFAGTPGIIITSLLVLMLVTAACMPAVVKLLVLLLPRNPITPATRPGMETFPFFSIHMAIYDEPPGMVIDSLKCLANLDWPAECFEVIVIDNNTADQTIWQPVEEWCLQRGKSFRFIHRDGVVGAKAGALNIALEETSPEAGHIVTVDADYQVNPRFLTRAAEIISSGSFSHIQFPQAYRDSDNPAVAAELGQYFSGYACAANGTSSMLLTGTMSVIRRDDLLKVGGWPTDTITEDADLGTRLLASGGSGIYVNEIHGTGLLPSSLPCLSKQRLRWAEGNAKVLGKTLSQNRLPKKHRIAIGGQLCAWLQGAHLLLPVIIGADFVGSMTPWGILAIMIFLSLQILEVLTVILTAEGNLSLRLRAAGVRFALLGEGSRGLCGLFPFRRPAFVRTLKSGSPRGRCAPCELVSPILMALLFTLSVHHGILGFAVITAVLTLRFIARFCLSAALSNSQPAAVPGLPAGSITPLPDL